MRSIRFKRSYKTALLVLAPIAVSVCAYAQQDQGAVVGVVTDSVGAVIPKAQVTLTNTDQGLVLKVNTDGHGVYSFSPVKIGNYTVSAAAPGFATTIQENLHVDAQQRVNSDLALKPGGQSENVTVNTAPPVLETEQASVGQVFSAKALNDTPLNGRNWLFIAQLAAGVAPPSGARGAGSGDFSANGARSDQNNFILDGVDNNVNVVDFLNGASYSVQPPPDAIAEVNIQTSSYSAEFGHSSGAVVNASIKSGTNGFHGTLWEYLRNDAFNTHQYFDQPTDPIPKYRQNIFGGTLGGPFLKNKLFFFGDVQGNRVINGRNQILTVPTPLERQGDFSELLDPAQTGGAPIYLYQQRSGGGPNPQSPATTIGAASPYLQSYNGRLNVLNPKAINPTAQRLLNLYPLPNRINNSGGGLLNSNYTSAINNTDNTVQWDARVDYNASARDQAFVRYSYQHEYQFYPPPLGPILDGGTFGSDGNEVNIGENFAFSETHIFSPKILNEFRFGYNYGHFYFTQPNADTLGLPAAYGLGGIPQSPQNGGLPNLYFPGTAGIQDAGSPNYYPSNEHENVWQALDNVTFSLGNHSVRTGVSIQRIRFSTLQPPGGHGNYNYTGTYSSAYNIANTGNAVADFLSNNQNNSFLSSTNVVDDVRWDRAAYVQDDWKVNQRLTVNLGLRVENQTPYFERHGNQAAFYPTTDVTYDPTAGPQGQAHSAGMYILPEKARNTPLPATFTNQFSKDNITIGYSSNQYLIDYQTLNWGPRVGIAYKLSDQSVIRAGFGIYYGGLESTGFAPNLGLNYPFTYSSRITNPGNVACTYGNCLTDGITLENGYTDFLANGGLENASGTPNLNGVTNNLRTPYTYQFNLAYQQDIGHGYTASISYVGSLTRHASNFVDLNGPAVITPNCITDPVIGAVTNAPCGTNNSQHPFSDVNTSFQLNNGIASYNSLQGKVEKRLGRNLGFLATYTWSHQLTDSGTAIAQGDNFTSAGGAPNYNILGTRAGYANGPEDVRNRFTFSGNYILPVGKGQRFLNGNGIASQALGGWQTTLTEQIQEGEPFTVNPANFTGVNGLTQHAILIRDPFAGGGTPDPSLNFPAGATCPTKVHTLAAWFNPCAFKNPLPSSALTGGITTAAQALPFLGDRDNRIPGPGYNRTNMSVFKSFPVYRESQLQLRADIFNVLNTPAFTFGGGNDGPNGAVIGPGSYRFFQNNTPNSRFFQFALRYSY